MKSLKKCFSLAGGRKRGLSFAKILCGLVMLAVPLCTSCGEKKVDVQKVLEKENYKAGDLMVAVPGQNFSILATEVTQELYESVMGENPSKFKGEKNLPVECVSWIDAVSFCNKLSEKEGLKPCYSYKENTNAAQWDLDNDEMSDWSENKWTKFNKNFACDTTSDGYRLPTVAEWQWAAMGGQVFKCSGSDNIDEVAWYSDNSGDKTHPVAQKAPNGYGLYDMSGNVWEWCGDLDEYLWDSCGDSKRYNCGGSWYNYASYCEVGFRYWDGACSTISFLGFRIVRSSSKK
ncbi:formylglycine-generating enzyme family protein [uncultured Treponema sp.]|uniref:formylglycine-generating enzyme family protein n=1 Tax=uncultured Treponema sp. TaxID=162155 RepID=UPI0025E98B78|nr:formylglycine-generating enzyme family protein [uncultured Treponema sp.]